MSAAKPCQAIGLPIKPLLAFLPLEDQVEALVNQKLADLISKPEPKNQTKRDTLAKSKHLQKGPR